jgi:hypothetical protein
MATGGGVATDLEGRLGVGGWAGVTAGVVSGGVATVLVRTLGAGVGPDDLLDSDWSKAPVAVSTITPLPATTSAADRNATQTDRLTGTKSR